MRAGSTKATKPLLSVAYICLGWSGNSKTASGTPRPVSASTTRMRKNSDGSGT